MSAEPLRVALPLGIGDAHWSCQKLRGLSEYHGGRPIHAYINRSPNHLSVGYLRLVPFIEKAIESADAPYDVVNEMPPNHMAARWATLDGARGWKGFDYVVVANGHLENGNRIETFFPEIATDFTYSLKIPQATVMRMDPHANRVLLYLSGIGPNRGFHRGTWSYQDWVNVVKRLNQAKIRPMLVGANTPDDRDYRTAFAMAAAASGAEFCDLVGETSLAEYCEIIRTARCWVGLNSGGGIVSAMLGTPTVMLWSDSRYPIRGVSGINLPLNHTMQRGFLSQEQLATYRTRSFGSPELTPENVVHDILTVMR